MLKVLAPQMENWHSACREGIASRKNWNKQEKVMFNMLIQLTAWAYTMNSIQQETNNVVIVPQYNKSCSKMNYIWQP